MVISKEEIDKIINILDDSLDEVADNLMISYNVDTDYLLEIFEKNLKEQYTRWCACGDEILIEGDKCEVCKFMEGELKKDD